LSFKQNVGGEKDRGKRIKLSIIIRSLFTKWGGGGKDWKGRLISTNNQCGKKGAVRNI